MWPCTSDLEKTSLYFSWVESCILYIFPEAGSRLTNIFLLKEKHLLSYWSTWIWKALLNLSVISLGGTKSSEMEHPKGIYWKGRPIGFPKWNSRLGFLKWNTWSCSPEGITSCFQKRSTRMISLILSGKLSEVSWALYRSAQNLLSEKVFQTFQNRCSPTFGVATRLFRFWQYPWSGTGATSRTLKVVIGGGN